MIQKLEEALQIQYIKLHFTVVFLENTMLPENKVSAIRGGMGDMLIQANCIGNCQCDECNFVSECLVKRTIYSKYERKPAFVTVGESVGYVIECEDNERKFRAGDKLKFNLLLFGKTIMYFHQFLEAFQRLGEAGLGYKHSKYKIITVTNSLNKIIYMDGRCDMSNYQVLKICDYVLYRQQQLENRKIENKLIFKTPLALKYQGQFIQEYQMLPILTAISRRIFMLDCYEGIDNDFYKNENFEIPEIKYQEHFLVHVKRYSQRKRESMTFKGIKGYCIVEEWCLETMLLLLAGELIHIGKNTSFGFGRYQIK